MTRLLLPCTHISAQQKDRNQGKVHSGGQAAQIPTTESGEAVAVTHRQAPPGATPFGPQDGSAATEDTAAMASAGKGTRVRLSQSEDSGPLFSSWCFFVFL